MPDPLNSTTNPTRSPTPVRPVLVSAALAIGLGLLGLVAPANAAPMQAPDGLANPGLASPGLAVDVGYRRYKKTWLYADQYAPDTYYVPETSYRTYRHVTPYSQQSDEIRELRRAFPSTNWPPSDRY